MVITQPVFSYDLKGTSLEGSSVGKVKAGDPENGWEGEARGGLSSVCPMGVSSKGSPSSALRPVGATSRCVLPLPEQPGSAALDFKLADRKHLYR